MERYTGPKKMNPPLVVCRSGPPFTDVCALQGSLERAQVIIIMVYFILWAINTD